MTDAISNRISRSILRDGPATVRTAQIAREVLGSADAQLDVGQVARGVLGASEGSIAAGQVARSVLLAVQPVVRVGQIRRSILRSRRDSPYPNFPARLFCAPVLSARLEGGTVVGGASPAGDASIEAMDVGARWVVTFPETPPWDRDMVQTWRSFSTAADLGVMNLIIPLWDRLYQPFSDPAYVGQTTFGRVIWRDTPVWEAEDIVATTTAASAQHSTSVRFSRSGGTEPSGGEHFSIYGPRYGWRLYRLIRRTNQGEAGETWEIRPPLREWVDAGVGLNFDTPRCTMRAEGDISEIVQLLRFGKAQATFVESFNRYP